MLTIFIHCMVAFLSYFANAQSGCTTPNSMNGNCVPLRDCEPLYQVILNFQQSSRTDQDFLRRSQCGQTPYGPLVCCAPLPPSVPQSTFILPSTNRASFTESDFPPPGACGTEVKERIVGGSDTSITDFPWMALIKYRRRSREEYLCGASIINKDYILTAAHCLSAPKLNGWIPDSIRFGEHDILSDTDCEDNDCADPVLDVPIGKIIIHENYVPISIAQYNDIALIRLPQSLVFTDFIKPVCLPFASQLKNKNFDGVSMVVAGFGRTENGTSSNVKLQLQVDGFNWDQCSSVYQSSADVTLIREQLCAGGEARKDSCNGDSGGPLMGVDRSEPRFPYTYLAGLVSRGPKVCGTPGFPAVYTRIDQYLHWIMDHMRK